MDTDEILRNVLHFYERILPKALCSPDWNEGSITNAFLWAEFCEQIHTKYANDEVAKELDGRIHCFTEKRFSPCFENLSQCTSELCQAFFQNLSVEKSLIESILLRRKSDLNPQELWDDTASFNTLCTELIESLKPISINNSGRSLYYEVKAELFFDFLKDMSAQLATEEQSETHLSLAFETLCQSPERMLVILHVLMYNAKEDSKDVSEIQDFVINWVLLKLLDDPNGSMALFLWKQPPTRLRLITLKYLSFHTFYMEFLTKCAQSLRLEYETLDRKWKARVSSIEVTLLYDEIVRHFQSLLSVNDDLCRVTREYMKTLTSDQRESLIWQDIFSAVQDC